MAIVAALVSELTGAIVRGDRAVTGEITLSGDVLAVGGIKQKVLAARRLGIAEVILPKRNAKDVDKNLRDGIGLLYVSTVDEALELVLSHAPHREITHVAGRAIRSDPASSTSGGDEVMGCWQDYEDYYGE